MGKQNKAQPTRHRRTYSDPLAIAMLPPADESPTQREMRLRAEDEARRVSDGIDEYLRQERIERRRNKDEVNVLLLGQSESGKSTTLKQFQLLHSPSAFHAERIAWRAVIYLNLVRSIRRILDALTPESDVLDDHEDMDTLETAAVIITSTGRPPSAIIGTPILRYDYYRTRLEPLIELEERLARLLSAPDEDEAIRLPPTSEWDRSVSLSGYRAPINGFTIGTAAGRPAPTIYIPQAGYSATSPVSPITGNGSSGSHSSSPSTSSLKAKGKEISVPSSVNWKKSFTLRSKSKSPKSAHTGEIEGWWEDPEDPVHTLMACAPTMSELWQDPNVRERLQEKWIRLEESSGFYLDEIPRITAKKYIPTDADILKARLKTTGVVEHTFLIPSGSNRGVEWRIYDVGGARNQRPAWAPYFEDVNAIIFLAPISAFDQVLTEDPRVNRLQDSLELWKQVVSNRLLANVSIVLFLNKCDLLQAKLEAGVKLNQHVQSYGDRANDYASVCRYFWHKFSAIHHNHSPNRQRSLNIHLTTVTDTQRTKTIISSIRDIIIKNNLRNMRLV